MSGAIYRRKAILSRIRKALDAFYLLQRIDWEYDVRSTLEEILGLALGELELEGGRQIERGLIIVQPPDGGNLEIGAGWKADDPELTFSRTVVQRTIETGDPILCENAKDDPRFMEAESLKHLETLSLISVPLAFESQRIGALYIESKSPSNLFNAEDLEFLGEFTGAIAPYLKTAFTHRDHLRELKRLQEEVGERYGFSSIIGRSASMRSVYDLVKIAAEVDRTVLITGESGSGKELIAHAIHHNGARKGGRFVVVDCSSLSEHLLESELFGHRKGAFTGASSDKVGAFQEADGGTIFLDEISDASKPLQQKLRRVLQEGEIRRVGENLPLEVDVRVICATNRSLPELVEKGEFIRDLYFRINKFPIQLPPLRDRREDIPPLVEHFLALAAKGVEAHRKRIHPDALALLVEKDWAENNVRELRNTVELAHDFSPDGEITRRTVERVFRVQRGEPEAERADSLARPRAAAADAAEPRGLVEIHRDAFRGMLERAMSAPDPDAIPKEETPFYRVQLEVAAQAIIEGLRASGWKLRPAARALGISPTKLRYELKEHLLRTLARAEGKPERAAEALGIPLGVLRKKASDLGLDGVLSTGVH